MQARKYSNSEYSINWTKDLYRHYRTSDEELDNCLSDTRISQSAAVFFDDVTTSTNNRIRGEVKVTCVKVTWVIEWIS